MWYKYIMTYYSGIKRNKIESFVVMWMKLESVIQSEVSQKEKNKYINTHICIESGKMVLMNLFAGKEQRHRRREWACGHSWGREGGMN